MSASLHIVGAVRVPMRAIDGRAVALHPIENDAPSPSLIKPTAASLHTITKDAS